MVSVSFRPPVDTEDWDPMAGGEPPHVHEGRWLLAVLRCCIGTISESVTSNASPCPGLGFSLASRMCCTGARTFIDILSRRMPAGPTSSTQLKLLNHTEFPAMIASRVWALLHPSKPSAHSQTVELWLTFQRLCPEVCHKVIADSLLCEDVYVAVEGYRTFAFLWRAAMEMRHSDGVLPGGIFLMLDALDHAEASIRMIARTWLTNALPHIDRLLDPLLRILLDATTIRGPDFAYVATFDARRVLYAFRRLETAMSCDVDAFLTAATKRLSPVVVEMVRGVEKELTLGLTSATGRGPTSQSSPGGLSSDTSVRTNTTGGASEVRFSQKPETEYGSPLLLPHAPPFDPDNAALYDRNVATAKGKGSVYTPVFLIEDYIGVLLLLGLRFTQSRLPRHASAEARVENTRVHAVAAEIVRYVMSSLPAEKAAKNAQTLADPVLQLLAHSVSDQEWAIQVHLLKLLRVLLRAQHRDSPNRRSRTTSDVEKQHSALNGTDEVQVSTPPVVIPITPNSAYSVESSPYFLPTLLHGLRHSHSDRNSMRTYWVTFLSQCLPLLSNTLPATVDAVITTLSALLIALVKTGSQTTEGSNDSNVWVEGSATISRGDSDGSFSIAQQQLCILRGLDDALSFVLRDEVITAYTKRFSSADRAGGMSLVTPVRLFSDFLKDVFAQEDSVAKDIDPKFQAVQIVFARLHIIVHACALIWGPPRHRSEPVSCGNFMHSGSRTPNPLFGHLASSRLLVEEMHHTIAIHDQVLSLLKPLLEGFPLDVISACLQLWKRVYVDVENGRNCAVAGALVEMIRAVEGSTPTIILSSAATITFCVLHPRDRTKREKLFNQQLLGLPSRQVESVLLSFMESYLTRSPLSSDALWAAWSHLSGMLRETLQYANSPTASLRLLLLLYRYLLKAPAVEDKKVRRDLLDITSQIVQTCVVVALKTFEMSVDVESGATVPPFLDPAHLSRSSVARLTKSGHGKRADPLTTASPQFPNDAGSTIPKDGSAATEPVQSALEVLKSQFSLQSLMIMSQILVPLLEIVCEDKDKQVSLLHLVMPCIVGAIRNHGLSNLAHAHAAVALLAALCRRPHTARAWQRDVLDLFHDGDFFMADADTLGLWGKVIDALISLDKLSLAYIMDKSPGTVFVSRETEQTHRMRLLKRLSFVLWSGTQDKYVGSLPAILEKLVESIRFSSAERVHCQVLLCLRVLVARISPGHLNLYWPMVLTELIRVFDARERSPTLILSALKFLDLLLVLQPEAFHFHRWMLIADLCEGRSIDTGPDHHHPSFDQASITARKGFVPYTELPFFEGEKNESGGSQEFGVTGNCVGSSDCVGSPQHASPTDTYTCTIVTDGPSSPQDLDPATTSSQSFRRPIMYVRKVESLAELRPYVETLKHHAYQNCLHVRQSPDWDAINYFLRADFVELDVAMEPYVPPAQTEFRTEHPAPSVLQSSSELPFLRTGFIERSVPSLAALETWMDLNVTESTTASAHIPNTADAPQPNTSTEGCSTEIGSSPNLAVQS
eukprot:Rmarinus@m.5389